MNKFFAGFILLVFAMGAQADKRADASYIQMLASAGLITSTKVEGSQAILVVTAEFHDSDYKSKDSVTGVVLRYYRTDDKSIETLLIVDRSGRTIGVRDRHSLKLY